MIELSMKLPDPKPEAVAPISAMVLTPSIPLNPKPLVTPIILAYTIPYLALSRSSGYSTDPVFCANSKPSLRIAGLMLRNLT